MTALGNTVQGSIEVAESNSVNCKSRRLRVLDLNLRARNRQPARQPQLTSKVAHVGSPIGPVVPNGPARAIKWPRQPSSLQATFNVVAKWWLSPSRPSFHIP